MAGTKLNYLRLEDSGLDKKDWDSLKKLSSPKKIQDFLNSLPFNFEKRGESNHSVKLVLESGRAHCFEGALVSAENLANLAHKLDRSPHQIY